MEENILSKKKVIVLIISLLTLSGLLLIAGMVNPIVVFEDSNLEEVVREKLNRPSGPIYQTDLTTITELDASNREIVSIAGLERFSKLADLNLENNNIEDFTPLENLSMLRSLNLSNNEITNLSRLEQLKSLVELNVDNNTIGDLSPLENIATLEKLYLRNNEITDLNGIGQLSNLVELNIESNSVNDLTPLKDLTILSSLNLRNNGITSLEEVNFDKITHVPLQNLSLRHNVEDGVRLSDISLLQEMTALEELDLRDNHIEDLNPLSSLVNLKTLDLRENRFKDIEPIREVKDLVELNIRENDIDSIEPLSDLMKLRYLNIHSNAKIQSLEPLKNLVDLETLIMRNVPVDNPEDILGGLTSLQRLNVINTGIENSDTKDMFSYLRSEGALQEEVRPVTLIHTIEPPTFSHSGGFYKDGFKLELNSDLYNSRIYYTLDGSEPTESSFRYSDSEQIPIEAQDDNSAAVIRAKIVTDDGNISETITNTYFVKEDIHHRFNLPVISIATDEDNLFDEDTGIYVGENAFNRGSDWERPIHIDFFEKDGSRGLQQNAGIRIHGAATRGHEEKSLRLYADSEYDDKEVFKYEIFEGLEKKNTYESLDEFKRLILRTSGDDWRFTMFRDAMMQKLVEPLGTMDTQAYRPSIVFINGEYWGIRNIRERYDEYYLENTYDVSKDSIVILSENGIIDVGNPEDVEHYRQMLKYIEENGLKNDSDYEYIQTLMDTENFRDYFIVQTYFGNHDWPGNNIRYWRKKTDDYEKGSPVGHDGRWRWMIFDTDTGFGWASETNDRQERRRDYTHNTINWVMTELDGRYATNTWANFLIRSLMENEDFKIDYLNRYADLLNSYFLPEAVIEHIDEMQSVIEPEMDHHIERWQSISSMDEWYSNVDVLRTFGQKRPEYIREHLMEEFNLEGTIEIAIEPSLDGKGYVQINTLDIKDEWTGTYFQGVPITLTAVSYAGYEFSHWEGLEENSTSENVEIVPNEDVELKAIFRVK